MKEASIIILSDYAKGIFKGSLAQEIIKQARALNKPVIVDPKGPNYSHYQGTMLLTPNKKELSEMVNRTLHHEEEIIEAARQVIADCDLKALLVTRGAEGMTLVSKAEVEHIRASAQEVFDVSGAGDTVIATLAVGLSTGLPLMQAVQLANAAAGIVVAKVGTAPVYKEDIVNHLHATEFLSHQQKILSLPQAIDKVKEWRRKGLKIGFTNGCFDLLHPGHISLLSQARNTCDRLIVGLNSDASVKRLKGPNRPAQTEYDRAAILASLANVDLVIIFEEDTPITLIENLKPDTLIKGADYQIEEVVGREIVEKYGGKVRLATLMPSFSTTNTLKRLAS